MDGTLLKDISGLGLAGLALLVLALTLRVVVLRKPAEAHSENLKAMTVRLDDLEKRIEHKDLDLGREFTRCWAEIEKLREFRHDNASNVAVLNLLVDRVRLLESRLREAS